jgi:predicted O-linked N-acetylglucosamine transferase (SPINDLY family)
MGSLSEAQSLFTAGNLPAAAEACQAVLRREPGNVEALHLLALVAERGGNRALAVELLRAAVARRADLPVLHFSLGNALRVSGQLAQAIDSYRAALRLAPDYADALINLGIVLAGSGQREEAARAWQRALELNPNDADALANLGNLCAGAGRTGEAIAYAQRALALDPNRASTLSNLGVAYGQQGRLDEAIAMYRRALAVRPRSPHVHSNLLLDLVYHDRVAPQEVYAEHRRWNETFAAGLKASIRPHGNDRDPDRRLRIGYVSPDLREHAVAFFMEPVLARHDPSAVEVFCYLAAPREDEVTQRLKSYGGTWRSLWGVRDDAAAEMVRSDRIDILVDLAVHTSGHRLLLFARKPAPVQVTWLGYAGTTGMDAIDYRLTDPIVDPPGLTESLHSERLVRLPRTQWCYQPPADAPAVAPPPCERLGRVTFGCATNLAKVTPTTLELWAQVLRAAPEARFALLARNLGDSSTRDRIAGEFSRRGIDAQRVEFDGGGSLGHYLSFFSRIDVCLDTHPFAGGTTTCHTLWMGVPVVTRTGRTSASRVGASVLTSVGLADLIAGGAEEFVAVATGLAGERDRLAHLRAHLRAMMLASALCDAAAFVRDLESAYRTMWRAWCNPAGGKTSHSAQTDGPAARQ